MGYQKIKTIHTIFYYSIYDYEYLVVVIVKVENKMDKNNRNYEECLRAVYNINNIRISIYKNLRKIK